MYDSPQVEREHIHRLHQRETVLSCSKARYYNPNVGRFVSEDPARFGGDKNFYRYVRNNPLAFKDPTGLVAWSCHVITGSASAILGAGFLAAECESECVAGKKVFAWVYGSLLEGSLSIPADGTSSYWSLEDYTQLPNAQNLVPEIQYFSIGLAWGPGGGSCGELRLGKAVSVANGPLNLSCGTQKGLAAGIGVMAGAGWIDYSFETTCCETK